MRSTRTRSRRSRLVPSNLWKTLRLSGCRTKAAALGNKWNGSEHRRLELLLLGVALEGERDEPIDERGAWHARRRPQLRIHADGGEAGERVDLVHVERAGRAAQEEVDRAKPGAVDGVEGREGQLRTSRACASSSTAGISSREWPSMYFAW